MPPHEVAVTHLNSCCLGRPALGVVLHVYIRIVAGITRYLLAHGHAILLNAPTIHTSLPLLLCRRTEHACLAVNEQHRQLQLYEWQCLDFPEPLQLWHVEQHLVQHS